MKDCNYTYMLRCADGSLYTGWTNDLEKRLEAHRSGKGGKYTRTHRPVELVYREVFPTKEEAMSREWKIKHLTKEEKEKLVRSYLSDGISYEARDPGEERTGEITPVERTEEKTGEMMPVERTKERTGEMSSVERVER